MVVPCVSIDRLQMPRLLYGTAWKEDRTQQLTKLALKQGFRGIDTANQRRHYHEAGVGAAITATIEDKLLTRDELFLQSKFTFQRGQDHRLPYDPGAPVSLQVQQSFASTLEHLGTEMLDSYLLHGPMRQAGLSSEDLEAWKGMEAIHDTGRVRMLGVSNFSLKQLQLLCQQVRVPPRFVQNRCYAAQGWDRQIREFCTANGITYQGFSLLTANARVVANADVARIAKRYDRTIAQIVFRFAIEVGMIPLTGTTDANHMRQDLDIFDFGLEPAEIQQIARLAAH
jgi:diketogulonate reductase-like aldo/keto reductase